MGEVAGPESHLLNRCTLTWHRGAPGTAEKPGTELEGSSQTLLSSDARALGELTGTHTPLCLAFVQPDPNREPQKTKKLLWSGPFEAPCMHPPLGDVQGTWASVRLRQSLQRAILVTSTSSIPQSLVGTKHFLQQSLGMRLSPCRVPSEALDGDAWPRRVTGRRRKTRSPQTTVTPPTPAPTLVLPLLGDLHAREVKEH